MERKGEREGTQAASLTEEELQKLVDETERKMLGLPLVDINAHKRAPDLDSPRLVAARKEMRTFILMHGRAPREEELAKILGPR